MTEYFAVIADEERWDPFDSMREPITLLKQTSKDRGHTEEQAHHFFLHRSAVERVETVDGKIDRICLGWLAREESGRAALLSEESGKTPSHVETDRVREGDLADARFTTASRKAAEVNEGGLVEA